MSVYNRNMKHANAIEFDETNLLAIYVIMLFESNTETLASKAWATPLYDATLS